MHADVIDGYGKGEYRKGWRNHELCVKAWLNACLITVPKAEPWNLMGLLLRWHKKVHHYSIYILFKFLYTNLIYLIRKSWTDQT